MDGSRVPNVTHWKVPPIPSPDVQAIRRTLAEIWLAVRRVWSVGRHAEHRSWLRWPPLGLLLLILGLALPWFAIPLQPGLSSWSLSVVLAGIPSASWVSYGALLAICLVLGLLAIVRSRGRAGAATAAVGAAVLFVSLAFVVASVTADWPLLQRLEDQATEQSAIFGQFGYAVPGQAPSLMLVAPVTGSWALLGGALRLGWFCTVAGGLVLLASGASSLAGRVRRIRLRGILLSALALLLVAGVLVRGIAADYLAGQGADAVQAGDYQAARASLADASHLDPLLASSTAYELTLGQVLLSAGGSRQPLAMFAVADASGAVGDIQGQVTDLRKAVALDPANPVLRQQLDQASQVLAVADKNPAPLQALADPTVADVYTQARVRYAQADYSAALASFQQVLRMTGDGNVISSAYTYIALSELKLGRPGLARLDLLRAVRTDTSYNNTLARSLLAGLYISTKSGDA
jgi:hypothetical protein